ncbi:MAG: SDR family oxidoreductase [Gammaproteobacteria bacterium]|nr:SDR family oxidoreductase [Gammaproteobacteria bacterium]
MANKKTALITGASRGIGYVITDELLAQNYQVVMLAQNQAGLDKAAKHLAEKHQLAKADYPLTYSVDVSDYEKVNEAIAKILQQMDHIDVLVNSAGIIFRGASEVSYEDFDRVQKVNVYGVFNVCKAVIPSMKARGEGYIINLSSRAGKRGLAASGVYASSKFAVTGLSQSLFKELLPFGVRVSWLCPSVVATDMTAGFDMADQEKIQATDIAKTVRLLLELSPNALIPEVEVYCKTLELRSAL